MHSVKRILTTENWTCAIRLTAIQSWPDLKAPLARPREADPDSIERRTLMAKMMSKEIKRMIINLKSWE